IRRGNHDDGRYIQWHDHLGVRDVTEEGLTTEPARHRRYLVATMPDQVGVNVVPGKVESGLAITRVGVRHRQPSERCPGLRTQGDRRDLTGDFGHVLRSREDLM